MIHCISKNSIYNSEDLEQFNKIQEYFNWSDSVAEAKIGTWMSIHNTAEFPTIDQMKYYIEDSARKQSEKNGYTTEMQQIKDQAVTDGTFMKAPNGKPTNLNERQWLQVRTKAFKEWFGDWESLAESHLNTLEILNEDGSINFDKLEELSDEYFKNADESLFNKGRKTLRERQEHHKGENNTLEHIQNVVKSAQQSNISDSLKQHVVIAAALHDLAKPFHAGNKHGFQSEGLLNKIFKGKVSGLARFAIAHHMMTIEEGQEFTKEDAERIVNDAINRNLDINEAIDVLIALHIADITRGRNLEDIDEYSNKSIREFINNEVENKRQLLKEAANTKEVNSVSKVVDKNGEPLVVYHGSNKKFSEFAKGIAIYTTSIEMANSYYYSEINAEEDSELFYYNGKEEDYGLAREGDYERALLFLNQDKEFLQHLYFTNPNEVPKIQDDFENFIGQNYPEYAIVETEDKEHLGTVYGVLYNKIPKDRYKEIANAFAESQHPSNPVDYYYNKITGKNYDLFNNIKNPLIVDAEDKWWDEIYFNGELLQSTRDIEEYARKHGYDGFIVYNVKDYGGYSLEENYVGSQNIYVAFNPNQTKSATDNIGTFSKEDDNIYKSEDFSKKLKSYTERWTTELQELIDINPDRANAVVADFNEKHFNVNFGVYNGKVTDKNLKIDNISIDNPEAILQHFKNKAKSKEIENIIFNTVYESLIGDTISKSSNAHLKHIFNSIRNKFVKNGIEFSFEYNTSIESSMAFQWREGKPVIFINPNNLRAELTLSDNPLERYTELIIHELTHGLMSSLLEINEEDIKNLSPEAQKCYNDIYDLYNSIKDKLPESYGKTTIHEFISEALSNKEFQLELAKIKYDNTKSLLDRFIEKFVKIVSEYLGIDIKDSALEKVLQITSNFTHTEDSLELINFLSDNNSIYNSQTIINPIFKEESSSGYRERTIKNAKADATIAFAVDFNSAGERLTKKSVLQQNKKYIPIDTNNPEISDELVESTVNQLNAVNAKSLNIAGNGIYTLKGKYTQEQVDEYVYNLLNRVINHPNLKTKIETIRSGGQTGYDEAGIKAAMRLGITSGILAPKGWKFRNVEGKDISDEKAFKDRFNLTTQQSSTIKTTEQPINTHQEFTPVNTTLEQQMKQEWTPQIVQFRTLRIVSEFKKCVNNLERKLDASEQLATQSATRQYLITTKYGTSKILGKVKDSITKTYANLDWVTDFVHDLYEEEDWNTKEVIDKINHIYEQGQLMLKYFEPLCFEASMYIKNMEGVSLLTNDGELVEIDDETTIDEEDFTKHEEGWFYNAHEQSVESQISAETKSVLQNLYETDEYGEPVQYDDLEQSLTLDYRMVLGTVLQLVGKCTSNSQMIPTIKNEVAKHGWMQQILDILMGKDTNFSQIYKGLSKEDIELKAFNLRALFWKDMHKIFVNIAQQTITDKGDIETDIVNHKEGADALMAQFEDDCYDCKPIFDENHKHYKTVYKADGSFDRSIYNSLHEEVSKSNLYKSIIDGTCTSEEIDLIDKVLKSFGVNITKNTIEQLIKGGEETKNSRDNLKNVIFGFYAKNIDNNQPLQSVIKENVNIFDAFRDNYKKIAEIFADNTDGYDESSARVEVDNESKSLFSRIFPNPIHTIFNKLKNNDNLNEEEYQKRIDDEYGHNWWFAPIRKNDRGIFGKGLLNDILTNLGVRNGLRIKTLKASQGISYGHEIDAQAEETRLNEFEASNRNVLGVAFRDFSVPTFSDTGESYYISMPYFDIHNDNQRKELIDRLCEVFKQEMRRINVVEKRAKAGIKPIASFDIEFKFNPKTGKNERVESTTDGSNFHFFKNLNKDKKNIIEQYNSLSIDINAQDKYIRDLVRQSLNEEFIKYLNHYNSCQVNQLPKGKHTEKDRKQLISFINKTVDNRKNIPLTDDQKRVIDNILHILQNDTITEEIFNDLKETLKTTLTEGLVQNEFTANIIRTIDSFALNTENLEKLKDYFYNSFYATTQIIELTMRDPAFLGTNDKFQKRFKMFYSPVQTCYTTEYDLQRYNETGEIVELDSNRKNALSKDTEYSLILVDDEITQAMSFDNIKSAIEKRFQDGYLNRTQADEILKNMKDINVADAQCYRTLPSWQKCLNMIGKGYNKKMQQSINRLMDGTWSYEDYHNVWEIFKPFVASYSNIESGITEELGEQYSNIEVPIMHKNAEFLLLAMYTQLSGVMKTNEKLKALNEFMVKHGIDKVQFESAVKVGSQAPININVCKTADEVTSTLEIATGLKDNMQANEGDQQVVHSIPFSDWGISTSMPEHLLDHEESSMGTQLMKIIMEGLSENPNKKVRVGNTTKTYKQWLELYQAIHVQNLKDAFKEVGKIFNSNEELAEYLKKQILKQNKYSHDLIKHLKVVNGNFVYPIIDPLLRSQFDSLCSSLVRNTVTKRMMRMGALPQVASYGFEEELQLRFTDRNGKLILTEKEFNEEGSNIEGIETWEAYKEYAKDNCTNLAYMEVYLPPFDTTLMRKINDACIYKEDVYDKNGKRIHRSGEFNDKLFNKIFAKELLEGLANRVPTETKHSIIPIYVKGFLPAQNSSCVIIPAEWIAISDSDNDGDKLYCYFYHSKADWNINQMKRDYASHYGWKYLTKSQREENIKNLSNFKNKNYKKSEELDILWNSVPRLADPNDPVWQLITKEVIDDDDDANVIGSSTLNTKVTKFKIEDDEEFRRVKEFYRQAYLMYEKYCKIKPVEFKEVGLERLENESDEDYQQRIDLASIESNNREARNNKLLELMISICRTDDNTAQILIPGGFPIIKQVAKDMKELSGVTDDDMSICNPAVRTIQQIRNMAGANLIGIYANHRSFRPLLEQAKCTVYQENRPIVNGNKSLLKDKATKQPTWSLSSEKNARGEFISDNISNFSGASVDNAKDPLLSHIGQNEVTAPISMFLIHCGYTIREVAAFMRQPAIEDCVREYLLSGRKGTLDSIIKAKIASLPSYANISEDITNLSLNLLDNQIRRKAKGILQTNEDLVIQRIVLENLLKILPASRAIQNLITVTKADTQVGALKARSSENKTKLQLFERVEDKVLDDDYPIQGAERLVPMLDDEESITESAIPQTSAFRYYGIESIADFMKNISMTFNALVNSVHNVALANYDGLNLDADTIDRLTDATISYCFSNIATFNNGDRAEMFVKTIKTLKDIKQRGLLQDNKLIKDLTVNIQGNKYSRNFPFIKLTKTTKRNYLAIAEYQRAWESLIVNGDKTITLSDGTITYKQLSDMLLNYCFRCRGLSIGGVSFINLFPVSCIETIDGYNNVLQHLNDLQPNEQLATKIFEQYIANHPEDYHFVHRIDSKKFNIQNILDKSKVVPNIFIISSNNEEVVENIGDELHPTLVPYNYITFTDSAGRRYLYEGTVIEGNIAYQRMQVLGNAKNGFLEEYDRAAKSILFGDTNSPLSMLLSNDNMIIDTTITDKLDEQAQAVAKEGRDLTEVEKIQIIKGMIGQDVRTDIVLNNYTPKDTDRTGMVLCAII